MIRIANRFKLVPGMQEEYKKRHDEIWPEMTLLMNEAGIHNYSIWNEGDDLFQYYEVEDVASCGKVLSKSRVKKKWDEYMKELIRKNIDPATGNEKTMELMFFHK